MPTPHNNALKGQIASTILMPGDPLRAKRIAETYLENVVQFNDVRNMFGYTGTYKGHPVSVMGSGMGMPSIGIYSFELFSQYDVKRIIRIGSAGSYQADAKVYDVVLASAAYSESSFAKTAFGYDEDTQFPSSKLNASLEEAAKKLNIPLKTGLIHSSDVFYRGENEDISKVIADKHLVCVEMESFALFANARYLKKEAACLLTISDSLVTHEVTTAEERQNSFTKMMEIALQMALED
jgi:purine-nucleoside phosphorylase